MIRTADITGLVLAGGKGSRMGGVDKGLQSLHGTPLALHALRRLQVQTGTAAVNAHRNVADYEAFGVPVWPDTLPDHAGPLAGFLTGLTRCTTPWLLTVPCDTPRFPHDLAQRLAAAATAEGADMAMATAPSDDGQGNSPLRRQPVFSLLHARLLPSLVAYTRGGGRKIGAWADQHRCALVPFGQPGDDPEAFYNANTLEQLHALHQLPGR